MCSLIDLSIINVLLNFRIHKQMTVEHSSTKLDLLATKAWGLYWEMLAPDCGSSDQAICGPYVFKNDQGPIFS